jgi:hypothetical protein
VLAFDLDRAEEAVQGQADEAYLVAVDPAGAGDRRELGGRQTPPVGLVAGGAMALAGIDLGAFGEAIAVAAGEFRLDRPRQLSIDPDQPRRPGHPPTRSRRRAGTVVAGAGPSAVAPPALNRQGCGTVDLAIRLPSRQNQTEFNLARWENVLADPLLARLEQRIETDRHGNVTMSPTPGSKP